MLSERSEKNSEGPTTVSTLKEQTKFACKHISGELTYNELKILNSNIIMEYMK
jgi:hypothetical protein